MQKPLNTHLFLPLSLTRGIRQRLLASKASIITVVVLLLSVLNVDSVNAADFTSNLVYVTGKKDGTAISPRAFYTTGTSSSKGVLIPFTTNSPLGTFNRSTDPTTRASDELYISGEANTIADANETVGSPSLFYRVYRQTGSIEDRGGFIPLQLTTLVGSPSGSANWTSIPTSINLTQLATTPGDYVLEVYFQAAITVAGAPGIPSTTGNFFDGSSDFPYSTTFEQKVDDNLYVKSTWGPKTASGAIYKWSEGSNWSGGRAPDANTDVTIPRNSGGIYPTIDAGQAQVHDITISGSKAGNRIQKAALVQNGGNLYVYGNFQDPYGGYSQATGGVLYLSGVSTQVLDASSLISSPVILSNLRLTGAGTKVITSNILIKESLRFDTNNAGTAGISGRLVTGNFYVDLGATGRIVDETKESYIDGTVISTRTVKNNEFNNFGNIGVAITTNRDNEAATSPGVTTVTRNNYIYFGTGTSESISRGFQFSPDRTNIPQFDLEFKYLETELNNIPVSNLRLFRSDNGDIPFEALGRSTTSAPNTFTKVDITGNLAALFTLGNSANPLPVTLVSFTAAPTAQGSALLRWNTATESNNKGFGIERQLASGDAWQPVGYLATGNNATGGAYEYTDKSLATATFTPQAYYRLRQEDLDGKLSYSPVAVVSRSAVAASTSLLLSPVPVTGSNISLTFAEAGQAGSEISIINVQGQRLLHYTTQSSDAAALSLPVEQLAAGVYIVNVRVPGQALRHARFVKL